MNTAPQLAAFLGGLAGLALVGAGLAGAQLERARCVPQVRVVHVTRVVHVHDPSVNELVYLAGRACQGDGGIARGTIAIYPAFPGSYDYFCAWNDIAVKSNGMVIKL